MAMFPVIEISGSAFERGRTHGKRARDRVERSLANYARLFEFHGMPWAEAQRRALAYRDVIGAFDAPLLEEIEGIAQGRRPARRARFSRSMHVPNSCRRRS